MSTNGIHESTLGEFNEIYRSGFEQGVRSVLEIIITSFCDDRSPDQLVHNVKSLCEALQRDNLKGDSTDKYP